MMAFIRVIALALALASSSHPFELARDQYGAQSEDRLELQLLTEATDHRPEVQPDSLKKSTNSTAPDLQVGCGDGFIQESVPRSETDKQPPKKSRNRRKRSYSRSSYQVRFSHPFESISVWQPPTYQLSRPYFIPIYGVSGRIPIYYPPQPIYVNPGVPKDNPNERPFQGPMYLPPTTESPTTMTVGNRFNGGDNKDDRPVWGLGDGNQERTTQPNSVVPTRRPGGRRPMPPLIHNPTDPEGFENVASSISGRPQPAPEQQRPPPPPQQRPPPPPSLPQVGPNQPSRCVWAIISCCSSTNAISYECFEQRGCTGAFWDSNPCDSEFAQAAIAAALNYYN